MWSCISCQLASLSIFLLFVSCVCAVFSFLFSQGGQLVGLMPVLAACHFIYVSSIVCIVYFYMLVANKVLSLSPSLSLSIVIQQHRMKLRWVWADRFVDGYGNQDRCDTSRCARMRGGTRADWLDGGVPGVLDLLTCKSTLFSLANCISFERTTSESTRRTARVAMWSRLLRTVQHSDCIICSASHDSHETAASHIERRHSLQQQQQWRIQGRDKWADRPHPLNAEKYLF